MSKPNTEATGKPTPIAGCIIFIVILGMVFFLAGIGWYSYRENKAAIISISELEKDAPVLASTADTAATTALDNKIDTFSNAVRAGKRTEVTFNVEEMNLAIARYPKLKAFRDTLSVTEITKTSIISDISFPVRAGFDGIRYVNATMTVDPIIAMGSVFPIVTDITPDNGNPVPEKYTKELPTFLFSEYRKDEELAEVFNKLSKVTLTNGSITILSDPKMPIEGAIPENVDSETDRAFALFGLMVFMLVTTVIFLLWVKKRKQTAAE
ncbi:hypothetical protein ACFPK9_02090 [Rubritalea spongiae]|uniref:LPXTG cell wall anchor domain-containing protein n=1 Tax=Rubritalea spongiae TaxID=430797 RepID=A0ABW5E6Q9_9BACT